MFRVKLNINQGPMSGHKIIDTSKLETWEQAEDILERATRTGFAMGGHIEMYVKFEERPGFMSSGWFLCNEKPELV